MLTLAAFLLLLVPCASAQAAKCPTDMGPKLGFVTQLNVSGCWILAHDIMESDGQHLAVEPIMCVTERLNEIAPRYNPVTQQTYVSVPVMLRDGARLAKVRPQMMYYTTVSPLSERFANFSSISVSTDASSKFEALNFVWSPEESVGILELGCKSPSDSCCVCSLASRLRSSQFEALEQVILTTRFLNSTIPQLNYRLFVLNQTFADAEINFDSFDDSLENCERLPYNQIRFARSVHHNNCTARVYRMLNSNRHLIEPLLCHNVTSMANEAIRHDYSRDMYYLKLDLVLYDPTVMEVVKTQLGLSAGPVYFMRLWRVQSHVAPGLSRRLEVGPLMVSGDLPSAQLKVYCKTECACVNLKSAVTAEPSDLWKHITYSLLSHGNDYCLMRSNLKHPWRLRQGGRPVKEATCSP